ncbi:hypothetical protein [Paraliomyxa miuraensis]|uniref:hypothetical protein n=1 Tax=Paraliomyxa miuraensis TaxID=376150 RepID=UPI00224F6091|nr:hypothetical protein [Paraliomyxa miuraensis]MCX4240209.1 hypothetical protein [Paraliomyxa miuraensis]
MLLQDDDMWLTVDDSWTSRVISPALLDAARGDRSLWADMGPRISGFDSNALVGARAWAAAERTAMFHQGTGELGLPADSLTSVVDALGPLILQPPDDLEELFDRLTRTAVGIVVDALAAIPVVGAIARAIGQMGLMLWDLSNRPQEQAREYLPPPQVYERDEEEYVMNTQLLPALSTNDWTRLFLPRTGNAPRIIEIENGWLLDSLEGGLGFGFIPGTQQVSGATQAFWHKKSSRPGGSLASHQDVGDFYPGPAQLMTAIDQHVQRPGAAMWAVVPSEVRSAWRDHVDALKSFAYEAYFGRGIKGTGIDELNEEHRRIIVQQLVAPLHVATLDGKLYRGILAANSWTPKNPPDDIVEAFVDPWCDRLEKRQDRYLETIAVAYADPKSAAFARSAKLRDKLHQMRALLLEHPARHQVDQRDVIDSEYRTALFDATIADQLKAPTGPSTPADPTSLGGTDAAPEPPTPPQGGAPFHVVAEITPGPRGGGGEGLALGLGVLGLLWAARGTRRRRRRRP